MKVETKQQKNYSKKEKTTTRITIKVEETVEQLRSYPDVLAGIEAYHHRESMALMPRTSHQVSTELLTPAGLPHKNRSSLPGRIALRINNHHHLKSKNSTGKWPTALMKSLRDILGTWLTSHEIYIIRKN